MIEIFSLSPFPHDEDIAVPFDGYRFRAGMPADTRQERVVWIVSFR